MCAERDSKIVRLSIVTLHPLEEFIDTIPEGSKRERMVEVNVVIPRLGGDAHILEEFPGTAPESAKRECLVGVFG